MLLRLGSIGGGFTFLAVAVVEQTLNPSIRWGIVVIASVVCALGVAAVALGARVRAAVIRRNLVLVGSSLRDEIMAGRGRREDVVRLVVKWEDDVARYHQGYWPRSVGPERGSLRSDIAPKWRAELIARLDGSMQWLGSISANPALQPAESKSDAPGGRQFAVAYLGTVVILALVLAAVTATLIGLNAPTAAVTQTPSTVPTPSTESPATPEPSPTSTPASGPTATATASPSPTPSPSTSPTATPAPVIVDDLSPSFTQTTGHHGGWRGVEVGYLGHAYWSLMERPVAVDRATWTPDLPRAGRWEVWVYVPVLPNSAKTKRAVYRVCHYGQDSPVTIDQSDKENEWVRLDVFDFPAGGGSPLSVVALTDFAQGDDPTSRIMFDAVKWVWVSESEDAGQTGSVSAFCANPLGEPQP